MTIGIIIACGGGEIYERFHDAQNETWIAKKTDDIVIRTHTGDHPYTMAQRAIKTYHDMPACDLYLTTTSSSYIDTRMLQSRLSFIEPDKFYYGGVMLGQNLPFIEWNGKMQPQVCASGAALIMSRFAFELLAENFVDVMMPDDVLIGRIFNSMGRYPNVVTERIDIVDEMPEQLSWHYRFHTDDRERDIENLYKIHQLHEDSLNTLHL